MMLKSKKSAFTMLELVFAIVVIGILASLAMPRLDRDIRQEAGDNILSAIRYTQHLALMDNKSNPRAPSALTWNNWQRGFWHIRFERYLGNSWFYNVSSSQDGDGNIDIIEVAIDPSNGLRMDNTNSATGIGVNDSPNVFLTEKYGINNIDFTNCGGGVTHLAFDYLGRIHQNIYAAGNNSATTMQNNCRITFGFANGDAPLIIVIRTETGYANIVNQDNS